MIFLKTKVFEETVLHFFVATKPATWNATKQEVRKALGNLQGLSPLVRQKEKTSKEEDRNLQSSMHSGQVV